MCTCKLMFSVLACNAKFKSSAYGCWFDMNPNELCSTNGNSDLLLMAKLISWFNREVLNKPKLKM